MFYGYYIARNEFAPPQPVPAEFKHFHFVSEEDLVMAVRQAPDGARLTPDAILDYNAALAAASRQRTVLPLRFGASFPHETAIARLLAARRLDLLAALDRLEGKVELSVRATLEGRQTAEDRITAINEICRPLEVWREVSAEPGGTFTLEIAYLIESSKAGESRARLQAQGIAASGPRPPFHFLPNFLRRPVGSERKPGRERTVMPNAAS